MRRPLLRALLPALVLALSACGPSDEILLAMVEDPVLLASRAPVPEPGQPVSPSVQVTVPWLAPPLRIGLPSMAFAGAPPPPVELPTPAGLAWAHRQAEMLRWRELLDPDVAMTSDSVNTMVMIGPGGTDPRVEAGASGAREASVRPARGDADPQHGVPISGTIRLVGGLSAGDLVGGVINLDLLDMDGHNEVLWSFFDMPIGQRFELIAPPDMGPVRLHMMVDGRDGILAGAVSEPFTVGTEAVRGVSMSLAPPAGTP